MKETDKIVEVVEYDPAWPGCFEAEQALIRRAFGEGVEVEHIGSTAIPGTSAKPIIDIMAGVPKLNVGEAVVSKLKSLGYEYFGEFGIPGRHFFRKGDPRTHHLHWVVKDGDFWEKQVLFRDYLLAHPDARASYIELKKDLARRYKTDRDSYTSAKGSFVEDILAKARAEKRA